MGSVFLASKLLEMPKRVREIVNVFYYLQQTLYASGTGHTGLDNSGKFKADDLILDYVGSAYYDLRDRATFAENVILRELGFHFQFYLPYGLLIHYCQVLQLLLPPEEQFKYSEKDPKSLANASTRANLNVTQRALGYLNDSFYTSVHMLFQPNVLACAVISLACQDEKVPLPMNPPWFHMFDTFEKGN